MLQNRQVIFTSYVWESFKRQHQLISMHTTHLKSGMGHQRCPLMQPISASNAQHCNPAFLINQPKLDHLCPGQHFYNQDASSCIAKEYVWSWRLKLNIGRLCFWCLFGRDAQAAKAGRSLDLVQDSGQSPEEQQLRLSLEDEREAVLTFLHTVIDLVGWAKASTIVAWNLALIATTLTLEGVLHKALARGCWLAWLHLHNSRAPGKSFPPSPTLHCYLPLLLLLGLKIQWD